MVHRYSHIHPHIQTALTSAYESPNGEVAYKEITNMVEKLGDPFTRIVPPSYVVDVVFMCVFC